MNHIIVNKRIALKVQGADFKNNQKQNNYTIFIWTNRKVETKLHLLPIGPDRIVFLFDCLIVFKIRSLDLGMKWAIWVLRVTKLYFVYLKVNNIFLSLLKTAFFEVALASLGLINGLTQRVRGSTHGQILIRACTVYISDSEPDKSGSLPESSRTNPTPDIFVFHTIV